MAELTQRVGELEVRVTTLETWAGRGQAEVLAAGLRSVRGDLMTLRRVQDRHTAILDRHTAILDRHTGQLEQLTADVAVLKTDVAGLKTDVAGLKTDVAAVKVSVAEILRRLPEPPGT